MGEALFLRVMGALLLFMGSVSLATTLGLRVRRQDWRRTALFAVLGLGVGAGLVLTSR